MDQRGNDDEDFSDPGEDKEHEPVGADYLSGYSTPTHRIPNYFAISASLLGTMPSTPKPYRTFTTPTTGFHLATKPSLRLTADEAAVAYQLPDLEDAFATFFTNRDACFQAPQHAITKLQIWHKVHVQQFSYHNKILLSPQTLHAIPPSTANPHSRYNSIIISVCSQSDWPRDGLVGHAVSQLRMIFHLAHLDLFLMYVQHFNIVPQSNPTNVSPATGMHLLRQAVQGNGQCIGEVIPLTHIRSPAHLVPNFGREAHSRLTCLSSYKLSNVFWLNKYWMKDFYYALSSA